MTAYKRVFNIYIYIVGKILVPLRCIPRGQKFEHIQQSLLYDLFLKRFFVLIFALRILCVIIWAAITEFLL